MTKTYTFATFRKTTPLIEERPKAEEAARDPQMRKKYPASALKRDTNTKTKLNF